MKEKDRYREVAEAVRVEYNKHNDDVFLVFKITDERFKKRIKDDWTQDIDLKIIDKGLYTFKEDENKE